MFNYAKIARRLVDQAQRAGADQSEIYISSGRELSIEIREQQVDTLKNSQEHGIGIRVIVNDRLGYAYSSDLAEEVLENTLRQALANAEKTTADSSNRLPAPGAVYPRLEIHDEEIGRIPVEEKIRLAKAIEAAARNYDDRVKITESCTYQDAEYQVILVNSLGIDQSYQGSYCGAFAYVVAEERGDIQTGFGLQFSLNLKDLDPSKVGGEAARKAVQMLGAKNIQTQKAAVVFDPYVATNFLGVLAPALSAEAVQKGKSVFAGKVGYPVASPLVTLMDDGALEGAILSAPFDGEGFKTGETTLIKQGILKSYLHNTYTAAKDGTVSTGNAARGSYKSTPEVGTTNFYIQAGNTKQEQLIKEISRGLYITEVMGMHTANPISGDFSVGASGIWIENGELSRPVRGIAIAGNLLTLLKNIDCVADDLTFFVGKGSPTVRIPEMTISGI